MIFFEEDLTNKPRNSESTGCVSLSHTLATIVSKRVKTLGTEYSKKIQLISWNIPNLRNLTSPLLSASVMHYTENSCSEW